MPVCTGRGSVGRVLSPHSTSDSPPAVPTGSLGEMEAGEEAQAVDAHLPEQKAAALEPEGSGDPEPLSPGEPATGTPPAGGLHPEPPPSLPRTQPPHL